jgi:hypothetical protein
MRNIQNIYVYILNNVRTKSTNGGDYWPSGKDVAFSERVHMGRGE